MNHTPVRAEETEPAPVGARLDVLDVPEPPTPPRRGSKYASGIGTQLLEFWNVPRLCSATMVRNPGGLIPLWPSVLLCSYLHRANDASKVNIGHCRHEGDLLKRFVCHKRGGVLECRQQLPHGLDKGVVWSSSLKQGLAQDRIPPEHDTHFHGIPRELDLFLLS